MYHDESKRKHAGAHARANTAQVSTQRGEHDNHERRSRNINSIESDHGIFTSVVCCALHVVLSEKKKRKAWLRSATGARVEVQSSGTGGRVSTPHGVQEALAGDGCEKVNRVGVAKASSRAQACKAAAALRADVPRHPGRQVLVELVPARGKHGQGGWLKQQHRVGPDPGHQGERDPDQVLPLPSGLLGRDPQRAGREGTPVGHVAGTVDGRQVPRA